MITLVGLCGYAQVGKDTAAACMPFGWVRGAFADALKDELAAFIEEHYGFYIFRATARQKDLVRPLLVAHGACKRAQQSDYWIRRFAVTAYEPEEYPMVITDVRYANEVQWILDQGGMVIRLHRPGYGPANEEEVQSFAEIESRFPNLPSLNNASTPAELGAAVVELVALHSGGQIIREVL